MLDVLVIDDETQFRSLVGNALHDAGHRVREARDGAEGLALASQELFDLIISDFRMPKIDGMTLLGHIRALSPSTDFILMTAFGDIPSAISALKNGALDYLTKPFSLEDLFRRVDESVEHRRLRNDREDARRSLVDRLDAKIFGRSPAILRLLERLEACAQSDAPTLITGETGTGKELVARSLHERGPRRDRPFISVSCTSLADVHGRFDAANGGTLFLDEVGDLVPHAQSKVLRVLQEGVIETSEGDATRSVDVRVVASTNQDLRERIRVCSFRSDLYYRLNVLDIRVPALRDRRSDLPVLVEHFLARHGSPDAERRLTPQAWAAISRYAFPGNVRELEHGIKRALILSRGAAIDLEHLPEEITGGSNQMTLGKISSQPSLSSAVKAFERTFIEETLAMVDNKKTKAARSLGISRKNLWEKMRALGINSRDGRDLAQEGELDGSASNAK